MFNYVNSWSILNYVYVPNFCLSAFYQKLNLKSLRLNVKIENILWIANFTLVIFCSQKLQDSIEMIE